MTTPTTPPTNSAPKSTPTPGGNPQTPNQPDYSNLPTIPKNEIPKGEQPTSPHTPPSPDQTSSQAPQTTQPLWDPSKITAARKNGLNSDPAHYKNDQGNDYTNNGDGTYSLRQPTGVPDGGPEAPVGYVRDANGQTAPVNQYGEMYTGPQDMRLPAGTEWYHVPGTDYWTPQTANGCRMIINGPGKEPTYVDGNGNTITAEQYKQSATTHGTAPTPASHTSNKPPTAFDDARRDIDKRTGANEYGNVNQDRINMLSSLARSQSDLTESLKKLGGLEGDSPGLRVARQLITNLKKAANNTQQAITNVTEAQKEYKVTVDDYWRERKRLDDELQRLTEQRNAAAQMISTAHRNGENPKTVNGITSWDSNPLGVEDPATTDKKRRNTGAEIKQLAVVFTQLQPPIRDKALRFISGLQLSVPSPSGPTGGPTPHGTPDITNQTSPLPIGGVPLGGNDRNQLNPTSQPSGASDDNAKQQLLKSLLASPAQSVSPTAATMPAAMAPYGTNQRGAQQLGQQQPGSNTAGQPLSDDEFNKLLNNVRGNKKSDTETAPTSLSPSNTPVFNPNTTPSGVGPLPWLNQSTAPTGESAATAPQTVAKAPSTTGPSGTSRSTMPMMPMMPMSPNAGANNTGKPADRPKIANADPKDIYGDEIKHNDLIISPRPADHPHDRR